MAPSTPPRVVIFWAAITGAVAAVMLLAGGDELRSLTAATNPIVRATVRHRHDGARFASPRTCVATLIPRRRLATSVLERAYHWRGTHGGAQFDLVTKHDCAKKPRSDVSEGLRRGASQAVEPQHSDRTVNSCAP